MIYCGWLADDLLKLPALTSLLYTDSFSAISATLLSSMSLSRSTIPLKNIMLRLKQCRDGSIRPRKKSPLSSIVKQCVTQSMDISLCQHSLKAKKMNSTPCLRGSWYSNCSIRSRCSTNLRLARGNIRSATGQHASIYHFIMNIICGEYKNYLKLPNIVNFTDMFSIVFFSTI